MKGDATLNRYKWDYIIVQLEIDGIVVDERVITYVSYPWILRLFRTRGMSQKEEWFIFIVRPRTKKTRSNKTLSYLLKNI